MLLLLLALACVPFLGLVTLHWQRKTGNCRIMGKAFGFAFSASVLWALLGDYVSVVYPGGTWIFYLLLVAGAAYPATCAWRDSGPGRREARAALAALVYLLVFSLTAFLVSADTWQDLHERAQSLGSLSNLRGPLRR